MDCSTIHLTDTGVIRFNGTLTKLDPHIMETLLIGDVMILYVAAWTF